MNCQDYLYRNMHPKLVSRRWFFEQCGIGLGAMALGHLLADAGLAASATEAAANPLAPKKPHYTPKAKSIIFLFMAGAPSHLELFDFKPQLAKFDGPCRPPTCSKAIGQLSSIPAPSCSARNSSSPGMASAARNSPSCYLIWPESLMTLPSSNRW